MPIIKVLGTQEIFLSDPSISIMKTIRAKNIFYKKASGGIIIDNYRAMKFFIDRVFLWSGMANHCIVVYQGRGVYSGAWRFCVCSLFT